jgi:hypothetical protein
MVKIPAEHDTRERLLRLGIDPAGGSPERLRSFADGERTKWGR